MIFCYTHKLLPSPNIIREAAETHSQTLVNLGKFHERKGGRIMGARGAKDTRRRHSRLTWALGTCIAVV